MTVAESNLPYDGPARLSKVTKSMDIFCNFV